MEPLPCPPRSLSNLQKVARAANCSTNRHQRLRKLAHPDSPRCHSTSDIIPMIDAVWIQRIKHAIELAHGGRADYLYAVPVHDKRDGTTFWYGRVYVFNLQQGATAKILYAWFEELEAGPRRFYTVVRNDRADSPAAAVKLITGGDA